MSGLEVVGIVASISQLVGYSVKLITILQDICQNAAHSAKRYRRHERQVKQVIEIAELIRRTDGLHSESIESHLLSLSETTQSIEEAIERTLFFAGPANKFQKCLRVLDVTKADSAIFRGFDDLERDKSCLALCLLGNFGSLIIGIQSNVEKIPHLQGKLENIQKSLQDCTKIVEESRRIKGNTGISSDHGLCSSCGSEQRNMQDPVSQDLVQIGACAVQVDTLPARERRDSEVSENSSCTSEQTLVAEDDTMALSNDNQLDTSSYGGEEIYDEISGEHGWYDQGCTYSDITACGQASQINGSFGFGPSDGPRGHSSWFHVHAADKSNQWNGNIKDANLLVGFFSPRGS